MTRERGMAVRSGGFRVAREGLPLIAGFAAASLVATVAAWWAWAVLGWIVAVVGGLLTGWCVWFFRDPERQVPSAPGAVVSPADGVVVYVGAGVPPEELGLGAEETSGMTKLSVFMNVFNVHVNRSPVSGKVVKVAYKAGAFFNASFDKASELNERCSYAVRTAGGAVVAFVQIAGLVARRIVCRTCVGAGLERGERFGLIRFGSRVDVYLPAGSAVRARVGDRVVAGETVLGTLGVGSAGGAGVKGAAAVVLTGVTS